jgi:hypothetical protein
MAEREVDISHRINQELIAKHKKETVELWDDILSLRVTRFIPGNAHVEGLSN